MEGRVKNVMGDNIKLAVHSEPNLIYRDLTGRMEGFATKTHRALIQHTVFLFTRHHSHEYLNQPCDVSKQILCTNRAISHHLIVLEYHRAIAGAQQGCLLIIV